jgi:hypothetical protein
MRKLTDEQLENIFRKSLLEYDKEPSENSWPILKKKVSRNNFLKFGWKHFNIYQTAFFLSILILSFFYFTSSSPTTKNTETKNTNPVNPGSTATDTLYKEEPIQPTLKKEIESKKNAPLIKNKYRKNTLPKSDSISVLPDPIESTIPLEKTSDLKENNTIIEKKTDPPKPKKVITLIKRDTLILKDTVNIRRKKKTK